MSGGIESGEGVDLDRVLKGGSLAGVRYADPHLQVHLNEEEEGFNSVIQL